MTTVGDRVDSQRRPGLHATPIGLAAVAIPVVGWSFANTIVKLTPVPVVEFTFQRLWAGALCMLIVAAVARRPLTWAIVKAAAPAGVLFAVNLLPKTIRGRLSEGMFTSSSVRAARGSTF